MSRLPKTVAERLRPPMALHAKYVDETSQFRSFVRSGTRYRVDKPTFLGASMRRSRLFAREYLVVQMDDDEFVRQSPGCDAATWDGAFELWGRACGDSIARRHDAHGGRCRHRERDVCRCSGARSCTYAARSSNGPHPFLLSESPGSPVSISSRTRICSRKPSAHGPFPAGRERRVRTD